MFLNLNLPKLKILNLRTHLINIENTRISS